MFQASNPYTNFDLCPYHHYNNNKSQDLPFLVSVNRGRVVLYYTLSRRDDCLSLRELEFHWSCPDLYLLDSASRTPYRVGCPFGTRPCHWHSAVVVSEVPTILSLYLVPPTTLRRVRTQPNLLSTPNLSIPLSLFVRSGSRSLGTQSRTRPI